VVRLGPLDRGTTGPHDWEPLGWRRWLCRYCYAPRSLHPRWESVRARALEGPSRHAYLSKNAPHFREGW
jgi:hypothetical protein